MMRIAFPLLAAIAGCGRVVSEPPAMDGASPLPDAAQASDAALDGPKPFELTIEPLIVYTTGGAPIDAGPVAGRACFLQGVAGMLKASDQSVGVAEVSGRWIVSGTGGGARAVHVRCLTYDVTSGVAVSPQFDWTQDQPPVVMGSAAGQICGLTRVAGEFNGGGELVHAAMEADAWRLRGTSGVPAGGVSGSARCLMVPTAAVSVEGEVNWAQGNPVSSLGALADRACLLTLFVGSFLGGGESVAISAGATDWQLSGSSGQLGVAARARCASWK